MVAASRPVKYYGRVKNKRLTAGGNSELALVQAASTSRAVEACVGSGGGVPSPEGIAEPQFLQGGRNIFWADSKFAAEMVKGTIGGGVGIAESEHVPTVVVAFGGLSSQEVAAALFGLDV